MQQQQQKKIYEKKFLIKKIVIRILMTVTKHCENLTKYEKINYIDSLGKNYIQETNIDKKQRKPFKKNEENLRHEFSLK